MTEAGHVLEVAILNVKLGQTGAFESAFATAEGIAGTPVSQSEGEKVEILRTVQQNYEAFGRGDVDSILETMAEDVRFEHHPTGNTMQEYDIPSMRFREGKENVRGFFEAMGQGYEMHSFEPRAFLEGDGLVAVIVEFDLTVNSTGKRVQDEEIHLYEFNSEGKIAAFRHFLDTKKFIEGHQ